MTAPILITGATGFIGRTLTRDLAAAGAAVRVLARSPHKARELFGEEVEVVAGDLRDGAALSRACAGAGVVYHIAGIYRFGLRHRREVWEVNMEGAENLFRAADTAGVDKVVFIGSGGVLRRATREKMLMDEADFPETPPPFSSYKFSKWYAERRALAWARRGLPVTIASPTCPIGPEDEMPTPTGQIIRDFMAGRFPFYCRTGLNFVSVDDLSRGLQLAARHGRVGERYILGHENVWLKEFLDLLAEETGGISPRFALPSSLVWMAGAVGEGLDFAQSILPGSKQKDVRICLETAYHAHRIQFFSCEKARRELGWQPRRVLRESVQEAVAWFRDGTVPVRSMPEAEPASIL